MSMVIGPTFWHWFDKYRVYKGEEVPGGGYSICVNGGVIWIVAPSNTEITRAWSSASCTDALSLACACTGTDTWFIPNLSQLQNPGYACRSAWDTYSPSRYWTTSDRQGRFQYYVDFSNGLCSYAPDGTSYPIRAFRCVTY